MLGTVTPYYQDDAVTIYHGDSRDVCPLLPDLPFDLVVLDPPFDIWHQVDLSPSVKDIPTRLAFTNWQNRSSVEDIFGRPRYELVWHFADGRWVSHTGPRFTHELILQYGPTGDAYVGRSTTLNLNAKDAGPSAGIPSQTGCTGPGHASNWTRCCTIRATCRTAWVSGANRSH